MATTTNLATTVASTATPADYVTALNATINGTNTSWRLEAVGTYDSLTNTFVATAINMNFI